MTVAAEVLGALRGSTAGLTGAELAMLLGKRHPQVNMACRRLAHQGLVVRDGTRGVTTNRLASTNPIPAPADRQPGRQSLAERDWAWEGNVQASVLSHLARRGWSIISVADTARREPGIGVVAEKDGRRLLLEVKGWPGTTYARGVRAGQPKPTQPTLQATHWFADGMTTLLRRGASPDAALALVLPDKPRYRTLLTQAGWAIERLEITIYLVTEDGSVLTWQKEN